MSKHKKSPFFIIIILLIAGFLRFYNLMHDAPYFFNPDERNMAGAISQFRIPAIISQIPICLISQISPIFTDNKQLTTNNCSLNPHFFAYGQFPLYLAYASDQIFQLTTHNSQLTTSFPSAIFWLRFWSALFSTFTVLLVYLITKELFGNWKLPRRAGSRFAGEIGNYAAIIAAFTPGLIQSAHFGTTESLLTFFFLSSIYLSLKLLSSPKYLILNTKGSFLNNPDDYLGIRPFVAHPKCQRYFGVRPKYIILLSLVIGLSLGSKLTGIFFFVPPFLALGIKSLGYCLPRRRNTTTPRLWRGEWRAFYWGVIGLLVFIGSIVFFVISSPYNLVEPDNFKSAVFGYEADVAMGKYEAFYTRQFVKTTPIVYQAEKIFPFALGWPVFILGTLGLLFISHNIMLNSYHFILQSIKYHVLRIRYKKRKISKNILNTYYLILTTSFLIYFIPNAFLFAKWTRFMTPILPFFVIFSTFALLKIYSVFQVFRSKFSIFNFQFSNYLLVYWIIGLLVFIGSITPGLTFMSIYTREDTRVTASKWIYQNVPDKSYILSETANVVDIPLGIPSYNLQPTTYNLNVISFDFYHMDENPALFQQLLTHLEKADYVLIPSRRIFANYPKLPGKYPLVSKYYNLLFSGTLGFEKVNQISVINDENAEETYTVFDHPVIRIYRKVKSMTSVEYNSQFSNTNFQ